jgi:hypothetical protein
MYYSNLNPPKLLLTAGGKEPRVDEMDIGSGERRNLLCLECGDSVYTVDASPERRLLAAGTRGGGLHLVPLTDGGGGAEPHRLNQDAGVLSVRFISEEEIISSDVDGRCLLWQADAMEGIPRSINCGGVPVCSWVLCDDVLVGETIAGGILEWRLPVRRSAPAMYRAPLPPERAALAKGIYWGSAHAAVFPSRAGDLVLFDVKEQKTSVIPAGHRELYAIAVMGDELVSVGRRDGLMKFWAHDGFGLIRTLEAPTSIVAAAGISHAGRRLVLVSDTGKVGVYQVEEQNLSLCYRIQGSDYRAVLGPNADWEKSYDAQRQADDIEQTSQTLVALLESNRIDEAEKHLKHLDDQGYQHLSLGFVAHAAARSGNFERELRARASLADMLPDREESRESLCRYADALQRVWLCEEAIAVLRRMASVVPDDGIEQRIAQLEKYMEAFSQDCVLVVLPEDVPMESLIGSANAMNKPFRFRWALRVLNELGCHGATVSPQAFVAKSERLRSERGAAPWAGVRLENLNLATAAGLSLPNPTVLFFNPEPNIASLQFAIRFSEYVTGTTAIPMVVFDAGRVEPALPVAVHNSRCLDVVRSLPESIAAKSWLQRVRTHAEESLGRLINEQCV